MLHNVRGDLSDPLVRADDRLDPSPAGLEAVSHLALPLPFAFAEQLGGAISSVTNPGADPAGPLDPKARRMAVYESVRSQLQRWSQSGPIVLILDDLHWADPDSLDLVGFLARRFSGLSIAMVGALRAWPARAAAFASSLGQAGHARVVEIGPLGRDASAALLAELVGSADGAAALSERLVNRAWELARGNPMLIGQVAQTLAQTETLPEPGKADLARLQRTLLLSHLVGLGPDAIACVRAAAVLGTRIRIAVLEAVAALGTQEFVGAFDALVGSGALCYEGEGYACFSHDLLASAVYQDTLPARRQALHARAFTYYADHGDASSAAPHALAADLARDARALGVLVDAATRALREGAIQTGVAQLRAAMVRAGPDAAGDTMERLADALFVADRTDEALVVYQRILQRGLAPETRIEILGKAARAQAYAGDIEAALAAYAQALETLALTGSGGAAQTASPLSGLLAERAHVAWEAAGPAAALTVLDPSSAPAWPEPEPPSLSALRAYMRLILGDPSGLDIIVNAANAARHRLDSGSAEATRSLNVFLIHPGALAFLERFEEADDLIADARSFYHSAGSLRSTIAVASVQASIWLNQGTPAQVLAGSPDVGDGTDLLGRPRLAMMQAEALTWLGRVDESVAICDLVEETASVRSDFAAFNLGLARAQHLAAKGSRLEAAARYLDLEDLARRVGIASMATARWAAGAIEAALAAGHVEEAGTIAAWLEEANLSLGCTWPKMLALGARAGASEGSESARALYVAALGACEVMPLHRAAIALRYGAWLRRRGDLGEARATLAACVSLAEEREAALLAVAARAELSAAGGRRRRPARPPGLSVQEARAARMAVDGASTREIAGAMYLSPRTVESHLAHAYAKLGVHSKAELRRRRAELGL